MSGHTECDFETAIEAGLTSSGSYETRNPSAYDEALAFFPEDVSGFLKDSQPAKWRFMHQRRGRAPRTRFRDETHWLGGDPGCHAASLESEVGSRTSIRESCRIRPKFSTGHAHSAWYD